MDGSKRHATWVWYAVMLTTCAALTPLQVWENRARQAAWTSWAAAQANERVLNDQTFNRLLATFNQMRLAAANGEVSRAEAEAALNGGSTFELPPKSQQSNVAAGGD